MIGRKDIDSINRTRHVLRRLAMTEGGTFPQGKLDEACEAAERSLGNVLVVATVYLGVEISNSDLYLEGES